MVPKSPNFNVMYGISEFALHSVHFSTHSKKDESYCTLHIQKVQLKENYLFSTQYSIYIP